MFEFSLFVLLSILSLSVFGYLSYYSATKDKCMNPNECTDLRWVKWAEAERNFNENFERVMRMANEISSSESDQSHQDQEDQTHSS